MEFNTYRFKVKQDNGTMVIKTVASSEQSAKDMIMSAEGCPERALTHLSTVSLF